MAWRAGVAGKPICKIMIQRGVIYKLNYEVICLCLHLKRLIVWHEQIQGESHSPNTCTTSCLHIVRDTPASKIKKVKTNIKGMAGLPTSINPSIRFFIMFGTGKNLLVNWSVTSLTKSLCDIAFRFFIIRTIQAYWLGTYQWGLMWCEESS